MRMVDLFIYLIGFIITVPVVATWTMYLIGIKIYRHRWKAIHLTVNWTAIIYLFSDVTLFHIIFGRSFIGIISIVLMIIFTLFVVIQWKIKREIVFRQLFKLFWRICFLLFSGGYILLLIIGVIQRVLT